MSPSTIYLITGANRPRGIGLSLVAHVLSTHESAFVYAGVRDPENATTLQELKVKYSGRLAIVKYVSADVENNAAVAKEIDERHGYVDTVVANAAILKAMKNVSEVTPRDMEEHYQVNVVGTIVLFQSMLELLKKSVNPRFIPISSLGGSIGNPDIHYMSCIPYCVSKAALNWITRKIHFENEWLVAFPFNPGPVQTDMLDFTVDNDRYGVARDLFKSEPPTAAQAAVLLIKIIDESTREKNGGEFMNLDGSKFPW